MTVLRVWVCPACGETRPEVVPSKTPVCTGLGVFPHHLNDPVRMKLYEVGREVRV